MKNRHTLVAVVYALLPTVVQAGSISTCANYRGLDGHLRPLEGVKVVCWDIDTFLNGNNDFMSEGWTGSGGCVHMSFDSKDGGWCGGWDGCFNKPDIQCTFKRTGFDDVRIFGFISSFLRPMNIVDLILF